MMKFVKNMTTQLLRGLIHLYRYSLALMLPGQCRYRPTCSQYGLEALTVHGPIYGSWLTMRRLLRCHPWGRHGHDPVPNKRKPVSGQATHPSIGRPSATIQNR